MTKITQAEIKAVLHAMPEETNPPSLAELIFNMVEAYGLEVDDAKAVFLTVVMAMEGEIPVREFGPDGKRQMKGGH